MGCGLSPRQRGGCSSCGQRAEAPGPWGGSEPAWSSGRAPGCVCWGTEAWGAPRLGQKPHPTHTPWPGSLASSAPHQGLCIQGSCGRVHLTELLWGRCTQVRSLQVNLGVLTGDVRGVGVQTRPRVHVALAGTLPHSPPRASVSQPQGVRASPGSAPPPARVSLGLHFPTCELRALLQGAGGRPRSWRGHAHWDPSAQDVDCVSLASTCSHTQPPPARP